jgi:hypothetical protein
MNFTKQDIQISLNNISSAIKYIYNNGNIYDTIALAVADECIQRYFRSFPININDFENSFQVIFNLMMKYNTINHHIILSVNIIKGFIHYNKSYNNWKFY